LFHFTHASSSRFVYFVLTSFDTPPCSVFIQAKISSNSTNILPKAWHTSSTSSSKIIGSVSDSSAPKISQQFFSDEFCRFSSANNRRRNNYALLPHAVQLSWGVLCLSNSYVPSRATRLKPRFSPLNRSDLEFTSKILPALYVHLRFATN
jgi:hypothetical protein